MDGTAEAAAAAEDEAAAPLDLWDSWARFSSACNCLASSSLKIQKINTLISRKFQMKSTY